jgi:hypothetical protein
VSETQNPAPPGAESSVFVLREIVALLFVVIWLALFAGELLTGAYVLPFWFHCVAVGCLAYALGVSVATLTSFRDPGGRGGRGGHVGHVTPTHPPAG